MKFTFTHADYGTIESDEITDPSLSFEKMEDSLKGIPGFDYLTIQTKLGTHFIPKDVLHKGIVFLHK